MPLLRPASVLRRCSFNPTRCSTRLQRVANPYVTPNNKSRSAMSIVAAFERIDPDMLVEEETVQGYRKEHYYPVRIGETFHQRYTAVGKLGYGSKSTVWLCRDRHHEDVYAVLKVYVRSTGITQRELPVYEHINRLTSDHEGRDNVQRFHGSFEVKGPHGRHICLVHQPLGISLSELRKLTPEGVFGADLIRQTIRPILTGLQFLHKEAQVIHTDLQPNNMLIGIHDESVFAKFDRYEAEYPSSRKELEDRTIYLSRPMPLTKGEPSISDLSEARLGDAQNTGIVMPNLYRAPEVILDLPWSYPVDIWSIGMVIWHLFEPKPLLFPAKDDNGHYSEATHLAQMVAMLGPPALDFLTRSEKARVFWDEDGGWKGLAPIPSVSLETAEQRLEGEEKELFIAFMRKMLQWRPEDRSNCQGVFFDEWLLADLIESGEIVREGE